MDEHPSKYTYYYKYIIIITAHTQVVKKIRYRRTIEKHYNCLQLNPKCVFINLYEYEF